ncbi:MAG: ribosome hibernation-promoting factor, HPF/YfiA family [Planctomycetota bacterium]
MNIQISGRHLEVTDAVREYVGDRGKRLTRFFDRINNIQFILSMEGVRYSAEVVVSAPKVGRMVAEATEEGLQAAVDKVVDKMERQITRYKEKLRNRRRDGGRAGAREIPEEESLREEDED